ncbi:NAD-dependent succinate-semialdehyde dehydrogenase [Microbacterium sp. AK031]|uniref:NAD-dependent succinate-semialdehyde dehydrogenase n=1 Tax=Microbacterium sp. AK031 TaxID=2723076 RepID=UPI0021690D54|nr:NAD-dependent succinate-semialdehyde dehydrogenase [Microbacterium sp. AK031]MCS3842799.1 succinate-semialdehyde dehydrogenase/glutarate-semialdehyde dehydrogenase [Microbacterium sp. AK031]
MTDYAVVNPATGETLSTYDTFTDAQIDQAITAAAEAHRGWSRSSTVAERAALIRRAAELHRERREELADIFVREMGKPREAALGEVDFAADIAEYYADQAESIMADQPIAILGEGSAIIRRESLGPLLGIMPWNFPAYQIVRFAAPNLIVGNTILLKPAPQCPESSSAIAEIYREAGFPAGAYQNVLATNEQIADIIADPRVQGVSLTGSERAGAAVAEIAGRNLKKVALELGGSDPFIVLSTDDMDATVQAGVDARLDNNGQACNGAKRFIIVDDLYDEFVEKFVARMSIVPATDPMQDDTVLGPLASLAAAEHLQEQVDGAVEQGATLLTGGTRDGAFFAPTVLADVTPEMAVYREELFGPAAVVYRVSDEEAAVERANDTTYGLGSYLFTTDPEQAERVADRIEAGMVYVNLVLADSPELPFGGVKRSGTSRELGHLAADEFVNKKLIRTA